VGISKVFVGVIIQALQIKLCPHLFYPRHFPLCVIAQVKVCFAGFFQAFVSVRSLDVLCSSLE